MNVPYLPAAEVTATPSPLRRPGEGGRSGKEGDFLFQFLFPSPMPVLPPISSTTQLKPQTAIYVFLKQKSVEIKTPLDVITASGIQDIVLGECVCVCVSLEPAI